MRPAYGTLDARTKELSARAFAAFREFYDLRPASAR
jgi:hypothetical protein